MTFTLRAHLDPRADRHRSDPTPGLAMTQAHQDGAQATAASTRSSFVTESSLSQAEMAPAKPWAKKEATTPCWGRGASGWIDRAMNATA